MTGKFPAALAASLVMCAAQAALPDANPAASLAAKYAALGESLRDNPYRRPLVIASAESSGTVKGDVYAVVEHPFSAASAALTDASRWCDVMILHLNTKHCRAAVGSAGATLTVRIGMKSDQPVEDAYPVEFAYRVAGSTPGYFAVQLDAETGPLGTRDYHILLEAAPVENGKTFLHLTYSYGYGFSGLLATNVYLATLGAGKVGFTSSGSQRNGDPDFIGGMRGVVERNTMRYYLAVDAYLAAASAPPSERSERRLQTWFSSTEQYPRQLHEIDRDAYLTIKRSEVRRQQSLQEDGRR